MIVTGLWLITAIAYWRLQQKFKRLSNPEQVINEDKLQSEKKAYQNLQKVCRNNQQQDLRKALIQWGRCYWPKQTIQSLADIAAASNNSQLKNLLLQFDNNLYGKAQDSSDWNGESLLMLINAIRSNKTKASQQQNPLPELYRV